MKKKIVIANWKMNPATRAEAKKLYLRTAKASAAHPKVQVVVCPPIIFLPELAKDATAKKVFLGVQDIAHEDTGAYTGEVSPVMVRAHKAKFVIVGHSERRELGENALRIQKKVTHAIRSGLTVVLCVGEKERTDEGGYYTFIREEIESALADIKKNDLSKLMIAYEPIWAIGKSAEEAITASDLYEMILFIRKVLVEKYGREPATTVPLLYGAAVKAENACTFIETGGVDGLLVGSASLDPKQIADIITTVAEMQHTL